MPNLWEGKSPIKLTEDKRRAKKEGGVGRGIDLCAYSVKRVKEGRNAFSTGFDNSVRKFNGACV